MPSSGDANCSVIYKVSAIWGTIDITCIIELDFTNNSKILARPQPTDQTLGMQLAHSREDKGGTSLQGYIERSIARIHVTSLGRPLERTKIVTLVVHIEIVLAEQTQILFGAIIV